jgi:hypothetical protein
MAEFYVTYEARGDRYLAVINAPQRPTHLTFANIDEVYATLDALGQPWELGSPIPIPRQPSDEWLDEMATIGATKKMPKPDRYIFGMEPLA